MKDKENEKETSNVTARQNNLISRAFQKEELIEYSLDLNEIHCQILDNGLKEVKAKYFICECDPERSNPICEECFKKCHFNGVKYPHKEISNKETNAVCICGYKCHKPLNESEKQDKQYKVNCTFGELGTIPDLNFTYQDVEQSNLNICLLCYNICYEAEEKLIKRPIEDLKGFKCSCKNHNHTDIRIIFRKLRTLAKGNIFYKKYNFEGMTFLHFVNILTSSKNSFHNLFHSFIDQIHSTFKNIQKIGYSFEEHNTLNDLHLTSQVLLFFAQKCKNEYKIENKIENKINKAVMNDEEEPIEEEENNDDIENKVVQPETNAGIEGGQLDSIRVTCEPLCYFNDVVKNILTEKKYFKIMERKFDSKSRNIWQLKYYLTSIFHKFYIQRDFTSFPNIKVRDIILLTPIQRLLMISSIEFEDKVSKYVNDLNINYLTNIISSIESVISSQEKNISLYLILAKLYKMCEIFAKYSLFNHEQLSKLCSLNDNILSLFDEEKPDKTKDFLKLKIISPMLKILVFLSFYYNDQLIISALKGEKPADKLKFYHRKTEISKNITTNVILILTFLQRFEDEVIENQKSIEKNNNIEKNEEESESSNKIQESLPPNQHYVKCFRNVYKNCQIILRLSLYFDEEYRSGLVRLIDNDQIILFDYLRGQLKPNEKDFLQRVKYFTEQFEDNHQFYFNGYNSQQNEEKFAQKFEDIITEFNKNFVPKYYLEKNKTHDEDDESQILKKEEGRDNESENGERKDESEEYVNNNNKAQDSNIRELANNNNKFLIIKSFFLQSVVKYIHIMYFSHIAKKYPPEKFMIKSQIFKKIMEMFYNFIYNSPENSIFLLQSTFTTNFELLNDEQLLQAISLINTALENIAKSKRDITDEYNLFHLIKVALLKSSKLEILGEILKALRICSLSVNFINFEHVKKITMKFCKIIFNYHITVKNYFILMNSSKKSDRLQCFKRETEKIIKKFMSVLNANLDQKTIVEEKEFLDLIVSKEQLKKILYTKTINISLRTELINYYRKCFLETILDKKDINYFSSILINDNQPEKKDEIIDNAKYFKFFEFLVQSGDYGGEISLERDANAVKFELLNFQEVLTITSDKVKSRKYLEAIVQCVVVYFAKFSSLFFDSNGFNSLSVYEIVYYFLNLKKYIYTRTEFFKPLPGDKNNKVLFKRQFMAKNTDKIYLINPEDFNLEEQHKREKKDFAKRFLIKEKKKLVKPKNDAESVEFDLQLLTDDNFEFFNYTKLRKIFLKHIKDFIRFPQFHDVKKFFGKTITITEEKINKYKTYLRSIGRLKNKYDNDILTIISCYTNTKEEIEKGSFIKVLDETNAHYNTTYRMLLCKAIPFFWKSYNFKYKADSSWILYKLLQFSTTSTQAAIIEIEEQNTSGKPIYDLNELVDDFTSCIITIILREINYSGFENRNEYFKACLSIKLMKNFCEEHNTYFQSFFFNNTETSPKDVLVRYKNHIKVRRQRKKDDSLEFGRVNNRKKKTTRFQYGGNAQNENEIYYTYSRKASVFEYLLRVLGKIILLSHWINNRDDYLDQYFYDIYFLILEFLIETVQGSSRENLNKVFVGEKKGKCLFEKFLSDINQILIDDSSNAPLNYVLRKDLMDFIMAFLEESATPPNGIIEISSVLLPSTILDSIIATMNKLYEDVTDVENNKYKKDKDKGNDNDNKKGEDKNLKNEKKSNIKGDLDKEDKIYIKRTFKFTPEMKDYFEDLYFRSPEFGGDGKFELANRMYQYFKMLGQSTAYKNSYVSKFYFKRDMFTDEQVKKAYYNKNYKLINKVTNAAITENKFNDQFLCVSFFESITRTVFVQKEDEEGQVSVIFTINPVVTLLSKISRDDFIDNVDRSDRYTKLVSLLERCDNFFAEIKYREENGDQNCLLRAINNINFYILEVITFFVTLVINLIMISVLEGEGDVLYGNEKVNFLLQDLGFANAIYNFICIILWLIAKYKLLYMTECQKMLKVYEEKNKENDEEEKEINLTVGDKFQAGFTVLVRKNNLFPFFWNILFSTIGAWTKIYFFYIIQIFIIFNLSSTLKNLISSIAFRGGQLISVFYFSVIVNLCLASIAFYYFEEDFSKAIDSKMPHNYPAGFEFLNDLIGSPYQEPAHIESECGTFAYCLMTHLDYGMRFDGGIADRMSRRSYNYNPGMYLSRFFYEMVYFWSQTVMLQGMLFSIVIEAFSELRNREIEIEKDKNDICFICGVDKATCEKNGQKFDEHTNKEHNLWTYVDFILGLRFVDIQDTNAVNSYVMEKIERKELVWLPMYKEKEDEKTDE